MFSPISTSLRRSGGCGQLVPAASARSRAASQSEQTSFAMCSKMPAALQSSVTAKPSRSSFARRSVSEIPLSVSYVPSDATTVRARLESANAYVRRVKASSAAREGSARRGDALKTDEDSVVRQLKTTRGEDVEALYLSRRTWFVFEHKFAHVHCGDDPA